MSNQLSVFIDQSKFKTVLRKDRTTGLKHMVGSQMVNRTDWSKMAENAKHGKPSSASCRKAYAAWANQVGAMASGVFAGVVASQKRILVKQYETASGILVSHHSPQMAEAAPAKKSAMDKAKQALADQFGFESIEAMEAALSGRPEQAPIDIPSVLG